jgi:hypothetical protein
VPIDGSHFSDRAVCAMRGPADVRMRTCSLISQRIGPGSLKSYRCEILPFCLYLPATIKPDAVHADRDLRLLTDLVRQDC